MVKNTRDSGADNENRMSYIQREDLREGYFCCAGDGAGAALADGKMKAAIKGLQLITPEEAINDPAWGEDFAWLLGDETVSATAQDLSIRFINQNRKQFQCVCSEHCTVLFGRESNVNTWSAVWISNGALNYLSFDQG